MLQNNTNSENGVPVNFKKINWNTGKSFQKGQLTIIEFSYRGSAIRLDVPDSNYSDEQRRKMASAILKRVVISKDANNKISMKQVHIVPEYNYLIEKVNFKNESLKNLDKKFSGWLYFYDWLDKPLEVLQFNNGAITKAYKLKNSQSTNQQIEIAKSYDNQTITNTTTIPIWTCEWRTSIAGYICVTSTPWYLNGDACIEDPQWCQTGSQECNYWELTPIYRTTYYCFYSYVPAYPWDDPNYWCQVLGSCEPNDPIDDADDVNEQPDGDVVDNIKVELTDSCLQKAVNQINNASALDSHIGFILHETFTFWMPKDLYISQRCMTDTATDGITTQGTYEITIKFNECALQNASQEYIAATLYHEILHAYFIAEGRKIDDHQEMAIKYINAMKSTLMSHFPSLSVLDADALAWGGLYKTEAWKKFQQTDLGRTLDIQFTNKKHKDGEYGTPCTPIPPPPPPTGDGILPTQY